MSEIEKWGAFVRKAGAKLERIHMLKEDWDKVISEMIRDRGGAQAQCVRTTPRKQLCGIEVRICEMGDLIEIQGVPGRYQWHKYR